MSNLWILTEEVPKPEVTANIVKLYTPTDASINNNAVITPIMEDCRFIFKYHISGIKLCCIDNIYIKITSGNSSFFDYLIFRQDKEPSSGQLTGLLGYRRNKNY